MVGSIEERKVGNRGEKQAGNRERKGGEKRKRKLGNRGRRERKKENCSNKSWTRMGKCSTKMEMPRLVLKGTPWQRERNREEVWAVKSVADPDPFEHHLFAGSRSRTAIKKSDQDKV